MKKELTAWEKVEIARNPKRKTSIEYINKIFDDFIELHGDRSFKDDKAIICGLANIGNQNYTFIDTKGAYPGLGAEERGQGEAIARSMFEMAKLKVPVIAIIIGEGSSGGALAIGVANKVFMLENAIYSILSPEGYSSILWKDSSRYKEAAEKMKLTAKDLYDLNIIDKIIKEPIEVDDEIFNKICQNVKKEINSTIKELKDLPKEEIVETRYQKFRNMGEYITL